MGAADPAARRIADLLDQTHQVLTRGDIRALEPLALLLEVASADLGPGVPPAMLAELRRKAARNAACLVGAQRGLKAAGRRIAEVRAVAVGNVSYDAAGRRNAAVAPAGALTRRV